MLKALFIVCLCLSNLFTQCSAKLTRAVESFDVEEVKRILDNKPSDLSDSDLICHVEPLRAKIQRIEINNFLRLSLGFMGGALVGAFLGDLYWKKNVGSQEGYVENPRWHVRVESRAGSNYRGVGFFIGMILGSGVAAHYNAKPEHTKAKTILHLLINKVAGRIAF